MLLSSSNPKYPPFPLFSYFSVVVCLRCLLHHILSLIVYTFRENREFVSLIANSRIRFGLRIVFVCLYITPFHYHHCANFIWRHWTYKMPGRYNLSSVWVRLSIFSQLSVIHYTIYGAVWFQFTHFLCDDCERIYILCPIIIIKSEVWTITHCLGLGHETMVCAVCLSIFLWVNARPAYLRDRQRKWRHYNVRSKSAVFAVSWEDEYTSCNIRSCYGKIWRRKR